MIHSLFLTQISVVCKYKLALEMEENGQTNIHVAGMGYMWPLTRAALQSIYSCQNYCVLWSWLCAS